MTTDYKKIAETLKHRREAGQLCIGDDIETAIALCERMAAGELVEREDLENCEALLVDEDYLSEQLALLKRRKNKPTPPAATKCLHDRPFCCDERRQAYRLTPPAALCACLYPQLCRTCAPKIVYAPTPPAETQDDSEREHCERVALELINSLVHRGFVGEVRCTDLLMRERAQVRAESQAEIDRLRLDVRDLTILARARRSEDEDE
jgi:hypothetical protein